jgi:hypothetical protein
LRPKVFASLITIIDDINKNVDIFLAKEDSGYYVKQNLGDNIFCVIDPKYRCVNLRHYWVPDGQTELLPTKRGIALSAKQWVSFRENIPYIKTLSYELKECLEEIEGRNVEDDDKSGSPNTYEPESLAQDEKNYSTNQGQLNKKFYHRNY